MIAASLTYNVLFSALQLDRQTLSLAIRFLKAKTPEQRAAVDLDTHYTKVDYVPNLHFFFSLARVRGTQTCHKIIEENLACEAEKLYFMSYIIIKCSIYFFV